MTPIGLFSSSNNDTSKFELMSMALLLDDANDAIIWRGPRKIAMIQRLLTGVHWGQLDYLIIDTPPGTSDEHIAVMSVLKQHERARDFLRALLVTTPQMLAINDVRREITFCQKTSFHILGLIENMSGYVCPHCSECTNIFAQGGGQLLAEQYNLPFLGCLPIDNRLTTILDQGIEQTENGLASIMDTESMRKFQTILTYILDHWE
jgi:Mrp family chromosome partitioning ATPase